MGFNRENYKRIKEEYDSKYLRARDVSELRRREVYTFVPGVQEIDMEISGVGLQILECMMTANPDKLLEIREKNNVLLQ